MSQFRNRFSARNTERLFLLLTSVVLGLMFYQLFTVLQRDFADVGKRLANGTMMNLNDEKPGEKMQVLLEKGFYFQDKQDIDLIASMVKKGDAAEDLEIDNVGELNKNKYDINVSEAFTKGGQSFKKRVEVERILLGFSDQDSTLFDREVQKGIQVNSATSVGMGNRTISGRIINKQEVPAAGVLVRLQLILPQDSIYSEDVTEVDREQTVTAGGVRRSYVLDSAGNRQLQGVIAYARTDGSGNFSFTGLQADRGYNVLPLQPGFEFGRSKGVASLNNDVNFAFVQAPHTMKLFSTRDFNNLKREGALIVRTPGEVMRWFWIIVGVFFGCFFLLHIILSIRFPQADQLLLPVLMILIGLSFITLLSLQDPLRDRFLAKNTLYYFGGGIAGIILMLLFNLRQFTTDSLFYRAFVFKGNRRAANGWPWIFAALGLLVLTVFFGTGPEGSGVKVNLFGFQPSEIVKFLVLFFLAGYFATNEQFISTYSSWRKRSSFFAFAVAAILAAIFLFLIIGDLGPAMVVCFTFIILFSFSRGDFVPMAAAVVLYIVCLWIIENVWIATGVAIGVMLLYMLVKKKQLSESAVMAMVVMAGFMLLDKVPYLEELIPGPMQRLVDRKAIWQDAWDNEVFGGDHVANSIWAMATGGITGQGAGEGFAKSIPEAHTDMILPAMGEEFGWAGIICIFIIFLIYLHRSIVIGRHSGRPFLFYLCAGIGIATFVQFLLIAGGSTGALPLSGVALPFMSYGGSSLVMNMLAAGFLLSASNIEGSPAQMKFITQQQDRNLLPALVAACVGIVLLSVNVSRYLFNNQKWVVQPSLVADRTGTRMFSYNPRISILMNKLQAGNLLDRDGRILATSNAETINQQLDSLVTLGVRREDIDALAYKRQSRYYPFAEQMFFWTGDANTGIFNGSSNGYYAEYAHAAELRGFPTPTTKFQVSANRYREDRFLPQTSTEMTVVKRDYSALAHLLLAGINSQQVEAFKQKNRDVHLTLDAALQVEINQALAADDSVKVKRASVVIMDGSNGDVLASSMYPLPQINDWERMMLSTVEQNRLQEWISNSDIGFTHATQPGSTAKVLTALAAFNKVGDDAARRTIQVRPADLIRVAGPEPDEAGNISIERGLVRSNNSFFIRLANEWQLQEEMGNLYLQTGMFLRGVGGYYYEFNQDNIAQQDRWRDLWRRTEFATVQRYNPNNIKPTRGRGVSGMSWGQGELIATPASVARLAAGISNNGTMMHNRYLYKVSGAETPVREGVAIAKSPSYAGFLKDYMIKQSAGKVHRTQIAVAGKTGTPERVFKGRRIKDGWYVFFAPKANGTGHIVACVRLEDAKGSSEAVRLAGQTVIPFLLKRGYVKGFENAAKPAAVTQAQVPVNNGNGTQPMVEAEPAEPAVDTGR
ncbi:FtsW/RodA/SpoVE family cell cycle protein [Aridibaculum aurantiacum]|uniref:FtsW/RodA/SpoVE family cell cycle protein n=1 Tax=Aridibaculum aurantiacum TaxID=2810307 RepID=UPI001A97CFAE|nr:FtsW/RodA/SpoVE family cell cycle protein [Aridibaculum aurantiacum]